MVNISRLNTCFEQRRSDVATDLAFTQMTNPAIEVQFGEATGPLESASRTTPGQRNSFHATRLVPHFSLPVTLPSHTISHLPSTTG